MMIEGLKVTVPGTEVQQLLLKRAEHHVSRREFYQKQVDKLTDAGVEEHEQKMSSSSDPVREAKQGVERHIAKEKEVRFLAQFVDTNAQFLLDTGDLQSLGVISSRYY